MSGDNRPSQFTQHALLVAWGAFAEHIGLPQRFQSLPLKQKVYRHTPQTKVLEFLVAILAGLPHLQGLSRTSHPLDKDQPVAQAVLAASARYYLVLPAVVEVVPGRDPNALHRWVAEVGQAALVKRRVVLPAVVGVVPGRGPNALHRRVAEVGQAALVKRRVVLPPVARAVLAASARHHLDLPPVVEVVLERGLSVLHRPVAGVGQAALVKRRVVLPPVVRAVLAVSARHHLDLPPVAQAVLEQCPSVLHRPVAEAGRAGWRRLATCRAR